MFLAATTWEPFLSKELRSPVASFVTVSLVELDSLPESIEPCDDKTPAGNGPLLNGFLHSDHTYSGISSSVFSESQLSTVLWHRLRGEGRAAFGAVDVAEESGEQALCVMGPNGVAGNTPSPPAPLP